jgi:hypothetical protein
MVEYLDELLAGSMAFLKVASMAGQKEVHLVDLSVCGMVEVKAASLAISMVGSKAD